MRLSQDILYYRLRSNYPVQFFSRNETGGTYASPILYEAGADLSDHVVIIQPEELERLLSETEPNGTMFVCTGKMLKKRFRKKQNLPSVIMIEKTVSPISVNNALIRTYDEFEDWDNALKGIIGRGGSFQDLINCCSTIIAEPIAIIDRESRITAESESSKGAADDPAHAEGIPPEGLDTVMAELDHNESGIRSDPYYYPFTGGWILGRNIIGNEKEFLGRIVIRLSTYEKSLQCFCNAVLEHFYGYVIELYNKYESFEVHEITNVRLATLLMNRLNKKFVSEKLWERAFNEYGWDGNGQYMLVQFIPNSLKGNNAGSVFAKVMDCKSANRWSESLCFICKGRVLLFINMDRLDGAGQSELFETLVAFSKGHLLITGVSLAFRGMNHLCAAYEQTRTAIEYGTVYHPSDYCYFFEDYALDYMIRSCKGSFQNEEICSSKLLLLAQYDKEKGTDYYKTLFTYFTCRFNAAEAAKQLFINRSTFHYRLERIQELVNIDFDSEDERLYLAMSFKILAQ